MKHLYLTSGLAAAVLAVAGVSAAEFYGPPAAKVHGKSNLAKVSLPAPKMDAPAKAPSVEDLPWEVSFNNVEDQTQFTIIDANGDDTTWSFLPATVCYSYDSRNSADDWLICPPVMLQSGQAYKISFGARTQDDYYTEKFELKCGDTNNQNSMTTTIMPVTSLKSVQPQNFEFEYIPTRSGKCFFGFHALSDADQYKLHLTYVRIEAAGVGSAPSGVVDLTITPDGPFDLSATISMKAPTTTLGGDPLTSIDRIEVTRNGDLVKTFQNPTPGADLSFVDNIPSAGSYTYTASIFSGGEQGPSMSAEAFMGATVPGYPSWVYLEELSTPGQIRLYWEPVTKDENGYPIPAGRVKYAILDPEQNVIDMDVTATEWYGEMTSPTQIFAQFIVAPYTEAGVGLGMMSNMLAIGPAYTNFRESFPNGVPTHNFGDGYYDGDAVWDTADNTTIENVTASDGDNGYAFMQAKYRESTGGLFTGKIALPSNAPAITFDLFNYNSPAYPNQDQLELEVSTNGYEWINVATLTVDEMCGDAYFTWAPVTIGLQQFAGQNVQIKFQVTVNNYGMFLIDNMRITTLGAYDLTAKGLIGPKTAYAGESVTLNLNVANIGANDVDGYDIDIMTNGRRSSVFHAPAIAAGEWQTLDIPYVLSNVAEGDQEIQAIINFPQDTNASNNASGKTVIEPIVSKLPYVSDLTGTVDGAQVTLTWSEPYTATFTPGIDEDFEGGEDFAHSFGDFTFIDRDQKPIGGVMSTPIPGIADGETKASFFVLNSSYPQFSNGFVSHSGDKYLASMYLADNSTVDDWLITPRLNGASQVISFFARSLEDYYSEKMEILYSLGSLNPDDFIYITTVEKVPGSWTEYNIPVPNGARYFAIRSCATNAFMLFVDDFHYADETCPIGVTVTGYNIYLDGAKVNEQPIAECTYSFSTPAGSHDYSVSAVYDGLGESKGSNIVTLVSDGSDVKSLLTDGKVKALRGAVEIFGMSGETVSVFALDGTCAAHVANIGDTERIQLAPGLYIVRISGKTRKVVVR